MFKRLGKCIILFFNLMRVNFQLLYGAWRVFSLPQPIVSIFGGARIKQDDHYALEANKLAQMLVNNNISVLTGGGPGIMEAASCGAIKKNGSGKGKSMGIGVSDLEEYINPCVEEFFELNYFFARKWLLTQYSSGFIVFPGGFGTMDELSEVLTLMQTKKMKKAPIILIGKEYWNPFIEWVTDEVIEHGLIAKEHMKLFTVTDSLEDALCIIRDECAIS